MNNIKAILQQINNIILLLDLDGNVKYVSPSVKNILGYDCSELLEEAWWDKTSPGTDVKKLKNSVIDQLERSLKYGGIQTERAVNTSFGSQKWILWNTSLTQNDLILSIGTDITEKKKQELELAKKNQLLSEKNEEIQDSLEYASRLQSIILPEIGIYNESFTDSFVFFSPKDKVSGDFYWYYENEQFSFSAAVDCTGHGVPGAMLSVVGNSLLREIIIKRQIQSTGQILRELDLGLMEAMSKNNELQARDGMDISLVRLEKNTKKIQYSGAFRSCIVLKSNKLQELAASKCPIGFYQDENKCFEEITVDMNTGDRIYLFSDGITDQFGGPDDKKFKKSQLKEILIKTSEMTMSDQKEFIQYVFRNWQQGNEQTDDVLLLGLEI